MTIKHKYIDHMGIGGLLRRSCCCRSHFFCFSNSINSSCSRRAIPSLPAMLNIPAINSAVRVLSSLAGIGYMTTRGSTFESMRAIVGTCSIANSWMACIFFRGLRMMAKSGITFRLSKTELPKYMRRFVKVPGSHRSPTWKPCLPSLSADRCTTGMMSGRVPMKITSPPARAMARTTFVARRSRGIVWSRSMMVIPARVP